jgi:hypothetical protein
MVCVCSWFHVRSGHTESTVGGCRPPQPPRANASAPMSWGVSRSELRPEPGALQGVAIAMRLSERNGLTTFINRANCSISCPSASSDDLRRSLGSHGSNRQPLLPKGSSGRIRCLPKSRSFWILGAAAAVEPNVKRFGSCSHDVVGWAARSTVCSMNNSVYRDLHRLIPDCPMHGLGVNVLP